MTQAKTFNAKMTQNLPVTVQVAGRVTLEIGVRFDPEEKDGVSRGRRSAGYRGRPQCTLVGQACTDDCWTEWRWVAQPWETCLLLDGGESLGTDGKNLQKNYPAKELFCFFKLMFVTSFVVWVFRCDFSVFRSSREFSFWCTFSHNPHK